MEIKTILNEREVQMIAVALSYYNHNQFHSHNKYSEDEIIALGARLLKECRETKKHLTNK